MIKVSYYNNKSNYPHYSIEITQEKKMVHTHLGKTWTIVTTAILKAGTAILGVNTVRKHVKDEDNLLYAVSYAVKPLISTISSFNIRAYLWKNIISEVKKNQ